MHATEVAATRAAAVVQDAGANSATRIVVSTFGALVAFAGFEPGNHDVGYWRRMAPHQIRFLARTFANAT